MGNLKSEVSEAVFVLKLRDEKAPARSEWGVRLCRASISWLVLGRKKALALCRNCQAHDSGTASRERGCAWSWWGRQGSGHAGELWGQDRNLKDENDRIRFVCKDRLTQGLTLTFSERLSLTINTQGPHSFLRSTHITNDCIFINMNSWRRSPPSSLLFTSVSPEHRTWPVPAAEYICAE